MEGNVIYLLNVASVLSLNLLMAFTFFFVDQDDLTKLIKAEYETLEKLEKKETLAKTWKVQF